MKKVLFTLALVCGFACISFGAVSEATKAVIDKYGHCQNKAHLAAEAKAAYDAVRADIKANGDTRQKLDCARVATMVYANEAPRSFAEINDHCIAQMKDLGINETVINNHYACQYFLFLKFYNKHVTAQNIADLKAYYTALPDGRKARNCAVYSRILKENGEDALPTVKAAFEAANDVDKIVALPSYFILLSEKDKVAAAKLYLQYAQRGKLTVNMLNKIDGVIATMMGSEDLDIEKFKTQLKRIRIIYTNKLTTDKGKATYGSFVSVIANTEKSL